MSRPGWIIWFGKIEGSSQKDENMSEGISPRQAGQLSSQIFSILKESGAELQNPRTHARLLDELTTHGLDTRIEILNGVSRLSFQFNGQIGGYGFNPDMDLDAMTSGAQDMVLAVKAARDIIEFVKSMK